MNCNFKWLRAALLAFGLLACGPAAIAAESTADNAAALDPAVWGVYAEMVGTKWSEPGGNAEWQWSPDGTIVESRTWMMKTVIRRGANPGELVSVYGGGLHTYDGRIAQDGSVLWIRRGRFLKMPSRVAIVDGRFVEELVKLDDANRIAKVNSTVRFTQTAGPGVAAAGAARAGAASAAGAVPASASAAVAVQPAATPAPASAPAPAAAPSLPPTPAVRPSFGIMDAFVGQVLVGEVGNLIVTASDGGQVLNLTGSRDNLSFRHSGTPGQLTVLSHPDYSSATASLSPGGELIVLTKGDFLNGSHQRITYSATSEGDLSRYSESKPRALLSAMLSWEYGSQYTYRPNSEENIRVAAAEKAYSQQQAAENRQAELESQAALDQAYNRMVGDLTDYAARETQIQAEANEMVARVNAQAEAIRQARIQEQQQAEARADQARRLQVAENARQATERDQAVAQAPTAAPTPQAVGQPTAGATAAAGRSLRFVMSISLRNQPGDKVNPSCYSNIVSRPGPPGWGGPGFLPPGSGEQARAEVYALKSEFIAKCQASGRQITSDGNFNFQMNQSQGDEQRLQEMRARYAEDVSVSVN